MLKYIIFHKGLLDSGKWQTMSAIAQIGNLGSEVGRTINAKNSNNLVRFEEAELRMFELFDMIMDDVRWKKTGILREICRLREVIVDYIYGDNIYSTNEEFINSYFYNFAVLANNERRLSRTKS